MGGKYIKSKENSKMHGFGIQNIRDIVLKHQGTLDISYTQAEFLVMSIIKVE